MVERFSGCYVPNGCGRSQGAANERRRSRVGYRRAGGDNCDNCNSGADDRGDDDSVVDDGAADAGGADRAGVDVMLIVVAVLSIGAFVVLVGKRISERPWVLESAPAKPRPVVAAAAPAARDLFHLSIDTLVMEGEAAVEHVRPQLNASEIRTVLSGLFVVDAAMRAKGVDVYDLALRARLDAELSQFPEDHRATAATIVAYVVGPTTDAHAIPELVDRFGSDSLQSGLGRRAAVAAAVAVGLAGHDVGIAPADYDYRLSPGLTAATRTRSTAASRTIVTSRPIRRRTSPVQIVAGVIVLVAIFGGYSYAHSDETKLKCAAHKAFGVKLNTMDNVVCATFYE